MAYKNKVYVSMDADNDLRHYQLMKAWRQSDHSTFQFYDAHDINNIYDKSEDSIKSGLQERFRNTKTFVLLVGESTRYLYKYVRWEIEQALNRGLPCIIVNLNGLRHQDDERCPAIIKDKLAVHISFNSKILEYALVNWPDFHNSHINIENKPFHYKVTTYQNLDL